MKLRTLLFCLLAGCTSLPPEGTPYFESTSSGDNLYPAISTRIYATDQKVRTEANHPYNNGLGRRTITDVPGAFTEGLQALETAQPVDQPVRVAPNDVPVGPDSCCHIYVERTHSYFDGIVLRGIPEFVWRRAAGVPPFVDEPIGPE